MEFGSLLSARCGHRSMKSSNIGGHTSLSRALVTSNKTCMAGEYKGAAPKVDGLISNKHDLNSAGPDTTNAAHTYDL